MDHGHVSRGKGIGKSRAQQQVCDTVSAAWACASMGRRTERDLTSSAISSVELGSEVSAVQLPRSYSSLLMPASEHRESELGTAEQ